MFINQTIVTILFKFINFCALLGIAFFIFKKYIKPELLTHIEQKEFEKEYLRTQQLTLEKQQQDLDALLKEETLQCQDFRSKIEIWKKVVSDEQDLQEKEHTDALRSIKKRATDITLHKEHERVKTIVINAVVQDLEQSLTHTFSDPQKSSEYLDAIVHFMKENVS